MRDETRDRFNQSSKHSQSRNDHVECDGRVWLGKDPTDT